MRPMKKLSPFVLSILLLTSASLVAQTVPVSQPAFQFTSTNLFQLTDSNFNQSAHYYHTFHSNQQFDIDFCCNLTSYIQFDQTTAAARHVLTVTSQPQSILETQNYYHYHFTPTSLGNANLIFIVTDKNGLATTTTLTISIVP